jgi:hypothetical protein
MMTVNVLLSGKLKLDGYGQGCPTAHDGTLRLDLEEGSTLHEVIQGMGVPPEKVTMTMVNGCRRPVGSDLRSGDRVVLIPADVAALWSNFHMQNLGMGVGFDS